MLESGASQEMKAPKPHQVYQEKLPCSPLSLYFAECSLFNKPRWACLKMVGFHLVSVGSIQNHPKKNTPRKRHPQVYRMVCTLDLFVSFHSFFFNNRFNKPKGHPQLFWGPCHFLSSWTPTFFGLDHFSFNIKFWSFFWPILSIGSEKRKSSHPFVSSLDCHWDGSFGFLGNEGVFHYTPQKVKLVAGGQEQPRSLKAARKSTTS